MRYEVMHPKPYGMPTFIRARAPHALRLGWWETVHDAQLDVAIRLDGERELKHQLLSSLLQTWATTKRPAGLRSIQVGDVVVLRNGDAQGQGVTHRESWLCVEDGWERVLVTDVGQVHRARELRELAETLAEGEAAVMLSLAETMEEHRLTDPVVGVEP